VLYGMASDVRTFPTPFWLLATLCVLVYGAVLPFNNIASALLLDRDYFPRGSEWISAHGNITYVYDGYPPPGIACNSRRGAATNFCQSFASAQGLAGLVMSVPYTISAILTPLLGGMVDKHGHRGTLVVVSSFVLTLTHMLIAFTSWPAEILLCGIGIGYAVLASVIWPSIPSIIPRRQLGTAYGLVTTMQNCGLFAFPLLVGLVLDVTTADAPPLDKNPYAGVEVFFASLSFCGVACGLVLISNKATRLALRLPGGRLPTATGYTPATSPLTSPVHTSPGP